MAIESITKIEISIEILIYFQIWCNDLNTISKYIKRCISVMYLRLKNLIYWPDRDEIKLSMPECFKKCFKDKTTVIIDCFEVFIEKPSNLRSSAEVWSNYKHHTTAKICIGITPAGSVSFCSEAYGGRASDKHITETCGILDNLIHGDLVLADRGFTVEDVIDDCGALLNIPAFTKGQYVILIISTSEL